MCSGITKREERIWTDKDKSINSPFLLIAGKLTHFSRSGGKAILTRRDWKLTSSREASAMKKQRQNIFIKNCVSHLLIPICWQFVLRGNWQIKVMQTDWMSWKKSSEHPGFLLNSGKRPEKWVPVLQKQSKNCMQKRCR